MVLALLAGACGANPPNVTTKTTRPVLAVANAPETTTPIPATVVTAAVTTTSSTTVLSPTTPTPEQVTKAMADADAAYMATSTTQAPPVASSVPVAAPETIPSTTMAPEPLTVAKAAVVEAPVTTYPHAVDDGGGEAGPWMGCTAHGHTSPPEFVEALRAIWPRAQWANACIIAAWESGFDPSARHRNANGSTDIGILQVNNYNFTSYVLVGHQADIDAMRNGDLRAGLRVALAWFNGTGNNWCQWSTCGHLR
jgi:hypothetical protein